MSKPPAPGPPQTGRKAPRQDASAPAQGAPKAREAEEIPGRSPNRAAWKYVLLAAIFLAWLAFLIYCAVGGNG